MHQFGTSRFRANFGQKSFRNSSRKTSNTRRFFILTLATCMSGLLLGLLLIARENDRLRTEGQSAREELSLVGLRLADLSRTVEDIKKYSTDLDAMTKRSMALVQKETGLKAGAAAEEFNRRRNSSSIADGSGSALELLVDNDGTSDADEFRVIDQVNSLLVDSNMVASKVASLTETIDARRELLGSIPSRLPVQGPITSHFGVRISPFTGARVQHRGIDIGAERGAPVYATADGVVVFAGTAGALGEAVVLSHGYGIVTKYGHNSKLVAEVGDKVRKGQVVARVGSTGRSTGTHVHYEVSVNGKPHNPVQFFLEGDELLADEAGSNLLSLALNSGDGDVPVVVTVDGVKEPTSQAKFAGFGGVGGESDEPLWFSFLSFWPEMLRGDGGLRIILMGAMGLLLCNLALTIVAVRS